MNVQFATYPWAFGTPGGGERQLQYYFAALKKQCNNHEIDFKLYDSWNPELSGSGILHYFSAMPSSVNFLSYIKNHTDYSIVLSPNFWPEPEEWEKSGVLEQIKAILWMADLVIVNSWIEEEALVRYMQIDSSRIAVVYNGVDDVFFEEQTDRLFRKTYNITGDYILNVANIEPRKNQLAFIRALKEFPELKLVTIGGTRETWFVDAVKKDGGEQFIHIPPVEPASDILRSAIAGCEFFAMPSLVETPSISLLEAAAGGAKILTTDRGSGSEYCMEFATYINPFDLSLIRDGIRSVRASSFAPQLRDRIRQNYTSKPIAESLIEAYSRVLTKK